jgi:mono/diheme cytochrome c family protein
MKTFFKVVGVVLLAVFAIAAIGVSYLFLRKPAQRPAVTETFPATPAHVARGEYLTKHVAICFDCHSERTSAYGLPFKPGSAGVRGFVWDQRIDFPGVVAASNLTPDRETGLGTWTDGEILRAMREGVDREGKALFPIMPYAHFRHMSDDDAKSIVAYLRTLPPLRYQRPKKSLNMPLPIVEKFMPAPVETAVTKTPDPSDTLAYGQYLTTIANCAECHTPKDEREMPIAGMEFSGGWEMRTPQFRVVTTNITPHPSTWMGQATREEFIGRFRAFANYTAETAPAAKDGKNTLMPWIAYSGMTDQDLSAIYAYLKTVKPIEPKR